MERLTTEEVEKAKALIDPLKEELGKRIIGQLSLIERLLLTLFCKQHILIEGVPGLAKTLTVTSLAQAVQAQFQRIQFTPDLLPADLLGTLMYNPVEGKFHTRKGPVFTNILLADEVNRAPAKVQSALLEAMQERQVTLGDETHALPEPFMVLATQNPVEQDGTYPLPEAQMDRFMLKIKVSYPEKQEELNIIRQESQSSGKESINPVLTPDQVSEFRSLIDRVFIDPKVEEYIVDLIRATREPALCGLENMQDYIEYGASPRASIYLTLAARGLALIRGKDYVTPQIIKELAPDVLRHRIVLSYEAEADGLSTEDFIEKILGTLLVP